MRLMRFRKDNKSSFGAETDGGVVDLGARLPGLIDVRQVIETTSLTALEECAARLSPDYALNDVSFLLPVNRPRKIICVGINYAQRHEEYNDPTAPSKRPNLFLRTIESFVPHGQPILRPRVSDKLDYEGEIALVIGRGGRYIPESSALDHVIGLTVANEGTLRDWTNHAKKNNTQGKNFDASGSIGPWIDTQPNRWRERLGIKTWVNEELRQNDTTDSLVYSFSYLISYISQFSALYPGDIIFTGTPTGAGIRMDPPRYLAPGDVLRIEVDGVGMLSNPIGDETI